MFQQVSRFTRKLRWKIHGLALGMTLGLSAAFLNGGCPAAGQCATCRACAPKLSLLVLPFLADGIVMLADRVWDRWKSKPVSSLAAPTQAAEPGE